MKRIIVGGALFLFSHVGLADGPSLTEKLKTLLWGRKKCEASERMGTGFHMNGVLMGVFEEFEELEGPEGTPRLVFRKGVLPSGALVQFWEKTDEIADVFVSDLAEKTYTAEAHGSRIEKLIATPSSDQATCLITDELVLNAEELVPFSGTITL